MSVDELEQFTRHHADSLLAMSNRLRSGERIRLSRLVHAEANSPNRKNETQQLAKYTQGGLVAALSLIESACKFKGVDDRACAKGQVSGTRGPKAQREQKQGEH